MKAVRTVYEAGTYEKPSVHGLAVLSCTSGWVCVRVGDRWCFSWFLHTSSGFELRCPFGFFSSPMYVVRRKQWHLMLTWIKSFSSAYPSIPGTLYRNHPPIHGKVPALKFKYPENALQEGASREQSGRCRI